MRAAVARNTAQSAFSAPHVTTMWDVDMSAVLQHRAAHKKEFAAAGVNLTITAYFFEAIVAGLKAVPAAKPVWVRISASDWAPGGWDIDGSIALAQGLKALGCSAIHVSSGGLSTAQQIPVQPGYQVGFAEAIKQATGLTTIAVGLVTEPAQAEHIVASGQADAVAIGRAALYDPRWPWHAAASLGAQVDAPRQYWRSQPREYSKLFRGAAVGVR